MTYTALKIPGVWVVEPSLHPDNRGTFHEVFKLSQIEQNLGFNFEVRQVNQSESHKGVIRGIHWTLGHPGQAKYVSCPKGALWDVVVDLRPDSPTFGTWDAVVLSQENRKSLLISQGIGHAFLSLQDGTLATYLCTAEFDPQADRTLNPLDETIAIDFRGIASQFNIQNFTLSTKDETAKNFQHLLQEIDSGAL
jgi:dTDP-4-dehydrorhamnose 3,5-epimerase